MTSCSMVLAGASTAQVALQSYNPKRENPALILNTNIKNYILADMPFP